MSKTRERLRSSSAPSRSKRSVPRPASLRTEATKRFRGLCRLLPLPWANTTIPLSASGTVNCPARRRVPRRSSTSSSTNGGWPAVPAGAGAPVEPEVERSRSMTTSSSDVGLKSRYHAPTAWKVSGASSVATPSQALASSSTAGREATGTAITTRPAPWARATWQAARALAPVAMPSSTTTTVRPR